MFTEDQKLKEVEPTLSGFSLDASQKLIVQVFQSQTDKARSLQG